MPNPPFHPHRSGRTGKTRFALQVAANVLDWFPDGAWFLNLAAMTDPMLLSPQIATTLGLGDLGRNVRDGLVVLLQPQQQLVLDNLEQFQPFAALGRQIAHLVASAPTRTILAISRVLAAAVGTATMSKTAGTSSAIVERMSRLDSETRGEAVSHPFDGGTGGA